MGQDNLICPCSHPVHWNVDYIAHRTGKCILIYYITLFPYSKVTPVTKDDMGSYIYQGETASFHEKIKEAYCSHYFFGSWGTNFSFYN